MPSKEYEELLKIFRPERDLGPNDLIIAKNGDKKQDTVYFKKD